MRNGLCTPPIRVRLRAEATVPRKKRKTNENLGVAMPSGFDQRLDIRRNLKYDFEAYFFVMVSVNVCF